MSLGGSGKCEVCLCKGMCWTELPRRAFSELWHIGGKVSHFLCLCCTVFIHAGYSDLGEMSELYKKLRWSGGLNGFS